MKKLVITLLVVVMLLASTSVVFAADGDAEEGFENSPVFVYDENRGSWVNENNELLRFDLDTGRIAIPGMAWENANLEDSAIYDHNGQSLVDPLDTWD